MSGLEKAARALCCETYLKVAADALGNGVPPPNTNAVAFVAAVERVVNREWPKYVGPARAVLRAIREPDAAMHAAGEKACDNIPRTGVVPENTERAYECWQAMIDALLGETP